MGPSLGFVTNVFFSVDLCYMCACEVGTVGKISDCQPEGPGFNPRPGRGLNFGRPSFATPSVDRDVINRWSSLSTSIVRNIKTEH